MNGPPPQLAGGFSALPTARERIIGNASLAFLLDQVSSGMGGLGSRDALLVMAINQANIRPLTHDPAARARYGELDAPAPDEERRAVSVSSIAASLGLPFETVRRRLKALEAAAVCETSRDGVIVPESFLASPAYLGSVMAAAGRLRTFYESLKAAGVLERLPPPAFDLREGIPLRGAARLLSDYILRAAELLLTITGDIVSAVVLLGVVARNTEIHPLQQNGATPIRRPVSASGVSAALAIPPETVRRHLMDLAEQDLCVRTRQGFIVTEEAMSRVTWRSFYLDNAVNVQRLLAGLAERGVIAAWENG